MGLGSAQAPPQRFGAADGSRRVPWKVLRTLGGIMQELKVLVPAEAARGGRVGGTHGGEVEPAGGVVRYVLRLLPLVA